MKHFLGTLGSPILLDDQQDGVRDTRPIPAADDRDLDQVHASRMNRDGQVIALLSFFVRARTPSDTDFD